MLLSWQTWNSVPSDQQLIVAYAVGCELMGNHDQYEAMSDSNDNSDVRQQSAERKIPFGLLAYTGAGISIGFCFSKIILLTVLSAFWITLAAFDVKPHLQAALMWQFAAVAVVGIILDKEGWGSVIPMALAIASLAIIMGTLNLHYEDLISLMGRRFSSLRHC